MDIRESANALASFDPTTLILQFADTKNARNFQDKESFKDALFKTPIPVIAHELTHYFQTITTSNGLRLFAFWADSLKLKISIIREVTQLLNGKLLAPVCKSIFPILSSSPTLASYWYNYTKLLSRELHFYGSWNTKPEVIQSFNEIMPGLYQKNDCSIFGHRLNGLLFLVDMRGLDYTNRAVALGARHLREGSAKAIELIQARLTNAPGAHASHPSKGEDRLVPIYGDPLADPYYLSNWIYANLVHSSAGCEHSSSLEEFVAIADLALMMDSWIYHWEKASAVEEDKRAQVFRNLETFDITPAHTYLLLLQALAHHWKDLKRLTGEFSQYDVAEFQNALAQHAGFPPLKEMISSCEAFIEHGFPDFAPWIPRPVVSEYQHIFRTMFRWRREVLRNGAVLIDLMTSKEKILRLLSKAPCVAYGSRFLSPRVPGLPSGQDLGTDMSNIQSLHDVTDALMLGDKKCPFHCKPRCCSLPPSKFCNNVFQIQNREPRCIREQALSMLLEIVKAKNLEWKT